MNEPTTMVQALYYIFAALALGGAFGMVFSRNPVASLMFLVLTLFSIAVEFLLLDAFFIAAVQVIVYAGAIMVLFLFVIMLLNLGHDYRPDMRAFGWIVAGLAATGLMAFLLVRLLANGQTAQAVGPTPLEAARASNAVSAVAFPLINDYVVAFELTAILLLVAIVGAVLLAKRRA
jgi:NADH-quinone oxidoreductase subunit J